MFNCAHYYTYNPDNLKKTFTSDQATGTVRVIAKITESSQLTNTPNTTAEPAVTNTQVPTLIPTSTPLPTAPTCAEMLLSKQNMTDAQWNDFKESLKGMWIGDWNGSVKSVTKGFWNSGYMMTVDSDGGCDGIFTISDKDTALRYSIGQRVKVTGEISSFSEFLGFSVYLRDDPFIVDVETTSILSPTVTPIALTYEAFYDNYEAMTDLQKETYKSDVVGTRVHWTARVEEVNSEGRVRFQGPEGIYFIWVSLYGIPLEVAQSLNKGQLIEFEATVRETGTGKFGVGFAVYLDNPIIISIR